MPALSIKKINLENKTTLFFLLILIFVMVVVFSPVIHIDFDVLEYTDFAYYLSIPNPQIMSFLKFYLTDPYGTSYALGDFSRLLFGSWMTGYYVLNVILRGIAAISIYSLTSWWCGKRLMGLVAALFFAVAVSSVESTLWVDQFYNYVAVILLCLFLFYWKKFHDFPIGRNLKFSVLFFGLAIFISHIRLPALPLIVLTGEVYFFLKDRYFHKENRLLLLHLLLLVVVFSLIFFSSNSLNIANIFRRVSFDILIMALINGFPPIIYSFAMFVSNLFMPKSVLENIGSLLHINNYLANLNIITIVSSLVGLILFVFNLMKKNFLLGLNYLWTIVYPATFIITSRSGRLEAFSLLKPLSLNVTLLGGGNSYSFYIGCVKSLEILSESSRSCFVWRDSHFHISFNPLDGLSMAAQ